MLQHIIKDLDQEDAQLFMQIQSQLGTQWNMISSASDVKRMDEQTMELIQKFGRQIMHNFITNLPDECSPFKSDVWVVVEEREITIGQVIIPELAEDESTIIGNRREGGRRLGRPRTTDKWTAIYNSNQVLQDPRTEKTIFEAFCTIRTRKRIINGKWHFAASVSLINFDFPLEFALVLTS
jgi:hypothetical protein